MGDFRVRDLESYLKGLNNIFDAVRIVNPKRKEIAYESLGVETIHREGRYQQHWDKVQSNGDSISTEALREEKTLTKIEYIGNSVFIIMATPMIFGDDIYIVEMLKDITETRYQINLEPRKSKN